MKDSRGKEDAVMSSMLLARFLGRASARLSAFLTGFRVLSAFPPGVHIGDNKL